MELHYEVGKSSSSGVFCSGAFLPWTKRGAHRCAGRAGGSQASCSGGRAEDNRSICSTVTVLKETTLSGSLLVRPDGMITMPLLGDVRASGFTPLQLGGEIAIRLKKYIQDPNVSVILTQINSKKVYLIGEVSKIGPVDITPGMTLLEAISSAGGLTQYANAKKIYILRNEDGKHARLPVSYKEALKGNGALNLILKPGDTIVVP